MRTMKCSPIKPTSKSWLDWSVMPAMKICNQMFEFLVWSDAHIIILWICIDVFILNVYTFV